MANVLEREDIDLFYKLYARLLCFVNKQSKILKSKVLSTNDLMALLPKERIQLRDALFSKIEYIDLFIDNEKEFNNEELTIINSWKNFEKGVFFIYKHLKKYSIFVNDTNEGKAFAVSGISDSLKEKFPHAPALVETVLIPFKDRIIYDGLITTYSIHFGSGFRSGIRDHYERAKHDFGLITQIPLNKEIKKKKVMLKSLNIT